MAPNILRAYSFDELSKEKLEKILLNFKINKIEIPLTNLGCWLIYVGIEDSYFNLISNKITYGRFYFHRKC